MKVLHFVILLCVLAFPLRAFAAAPDLPVLLFVEAAASEAAYSGELSELLRARLTAAGWEIVGAETVGHRGTVGRFFHMVRRDADGAELHLIAFPGTERGSDVWTDLRMKRAAFGGHSPAEFLAVRDTPKKERGGMPLVHRGFLDYCQAALFTDAAEGETAGERLAADLRAHPSEKLYLTGHSLGGAAAILAAARLSDLGVSPDQLIVTTFGAPAVGNEDFVRTYQDRFTLRRVVMRGDPVKDALPSPLGFHHFGARIDWQPARTTAAFPHTMTVYVDAALRRLYDTHGSSGALTFSWGRRTARRGIRSISRRSWWRLMTHSRRMCPICVRCCVMRSTCGTRRRCLRPRIRLAHSMWRRRQGRHVLWGRSRCWSIGFREKSSATRTRPIV